MVAGKRNTLSPEDVEYAMEALNVEVRLPISVILLHLRVSGESTTKHAIMPLKITNDTEP